MKERGSEERTGMIRGNDMEGSKVKEEEDEKE